MVLCTKPLSAGLDLSESSIFLGLLTWPLVSATAYEPDACPELTTRQCVEAPALVTTRLEPTRANELTRIKSLPVNRVTVPLASLEPTPPEISNTVLSPPRRRTLRVSNETGPVRPLYIGGT